MHWSLSHEVEHFLVSMGVILDTRAHADHDTPRRVGGEDQHWVVYSSKL